MNIAFADSELFSWVILPLLIFFARICDVSIGTIRLIFLAKGYRYIAPILGFFEVIIWIVAVSQIIEHLDNVMSYIAYGAGFAAGNYIGMYLEEKLSIGNVIIRVIQKNDIPDLINELRSQNFGVTVVDAEGSMGKVKMIFSVIKRENIKDFVSVLNQYNPRAFYSIEDVRSVNEGVFIRTNRSLRSRFGFSVEKKK